MRIVVELFRYVVGASFLLSSFALAFAIGMALSGLGPGVASTVFSGLGITFALVLFLILVLMSGASAVLLSGHDRLSEIADAMRDRTASVTGTTARR